MSHLIASLRVPARRQSHWAIRLNITHQNPFRCVSQNRSTPNINPEANSNKPQEKHNVYTSQRSYGRAGMPPVHLKIPPTPTPVSLSGHLNVVQDHPLHAPEEDEFWRKIPMWKDVSKEQFMSYQWSMRNVVAFHQKSDPVEFRRLIGGLVPDFVPVNHETGEEQSRNEFIDDIFAGFGCSTMSVRLMPYIFSRINWKDPRHDPVFRQFIPLGSLMLPDHPMCAHDSLHEGVDSKVAGLVHRYPDKVLFLATSVCPTYCVFCTRAYEVGLDTVQLEKKSSFKPQRARWDRCLDYIKNTPEIQDVVISGGDSFFIGPEHLVEIGNRLIEMPNVKKFRFASKGLAVSPNRFLDPDDTWTQSLIHVSKLAEKAGKRMALHTHFNHANEISWITEKASRRLRDAGVTVRNQTVLLRGINDDVKTMGTLIRTLSDTLRIQPYYVYQCDMIKKAEHFRTPLQTILDMHAKLKGTIAGFDLPQFIVDLPGGGGKRDAWMKESYDRSTGISTYKAPGVKGGEQIYEYYDPVDTLVKSH